MKLSDFDYNLPPELIATEPAKKRDQSRLLVLEKASGKIEYKHFFDLPQFLNKGDVLVLNNSRVIPARLAGKKVSGPLIALGIGGEVEVLLNKNLGETWECLVRGRTRVGTKIIFSKKLSGEVVSSQEKIKIIKFNLAGQKFMAEVAKIGQVPVPPYILKQRREKQLVDDKVNYQTVYAKTAGSVAAPTAGLHFTPELLEQLSTRGVKIVYVTLHVGLGTFLPVGAEQIKAGKLHSEWAEILPKTWRAIMEAKKQGKKVVAVGTTTTRTLEYFFNSQISDFENKKIKIAQRPPKLEIENWKLKIAKPDGFAGWVDIFIYPPYKFKVVDALVTNFHLPKSTLLMLVSALAGKKHIDKAYQGAIRAKYRFYSYGDAMLIY